MNRLVMRHMRPSALVVGGLVGVALVWFFGALIIAPNLSILLVVLQPERGTIADTISSLIGSERVIRALIGTFVMGVASVVTVNVVGIAQAFFTEAIAVRGRSVLTVLYAVPLVFGSVSAVTGYVMLYGQRGVITVWLRDWFPSMPADWFSGFGAVLFVHAFTMTGYHFLFLRPALRRVDFSLVEAARTLGRSPIRALLMAVLPVLRPALLASTVMTFIVAISSFAAPSILGGESFEMITPLIQALTGLGRADMAAILGILTGLVTSVLLVFVLREERRAETTSAKAAAPFRPVVLQSRVARLAATVIAWGLALVTIAPLVTSIVLSFFPTEAIRNGRFDGGVTLEHYARIVSDPTAYAPVLSSTLISVVAISIALTVATIVAHISARGPAALGQTLQMLAFLPYFLPGILVALGFIIAFGDHNLVVGNAVLVGSFWILPLAYAVVVLPTATRFLRAAYVGIDPAMDEAARIFGARGWLRYRAAVLPALLPVMIQTAALCFNQTFDEYTVAVMLYNVNNQPLGVVLGGLAASNDPDLAGLTAAYVVVNTLIALAVIAAADRFASVASRRGVGAR